MSNPIVILHGWSDSAESFVSLGKLLESRLKRPVASIDLADWVSLDDQVSYMDLRVGLERAWKERGLPTSPGSVDVVVHSTGALVVRDWMTHFYEPDMNPVKRLLMLAPANFGSPLAHKGRAFYGRIIKGWRTGLQTGTKILKGLELGSGYTWDLAMKDILSSKYWYGANRVMATVLVGNRGYGGVRAAANEAGSDGTVRISTANLNATLLEVDFSTQPTEPTHKILSPRREHMAAFAIMDGDNHGSIIAKRSGTPQNNATIELILGALQVEAPDWPNWCARLEGITKSVSDSAVTSNGRPVRDDNNHTFQNTVVRVTDNVGNAVQDYFLEFYSNDANTSRFAAFFHRDAIRSVHRHSDDRHYRNIYVNATLLHHRISSGVASLDVSLTAEPEFHAGKTRVGYNTYNPQTFGHLSLTPTNVESLFVGNRTLLVDIKIRRELDRVVEIRPL